MTPAPSPAHLAAGDRVRVCISAEAERILRLNRRAWLESPDGAAWLVTDEGVAFLARHPYALALRVSA